MRVAVDGRLFTFARCARAGVVGCRPVACYEGSRNVRSAWSDRVLGKVLGA